MRCPGFSADAIIEVPRLDADGTLASYPKQPPDRGGDDPGAHVPAGDRPRAVLRAEQSAVPQLRLSAPADAALRHLLLPGRGRRGQARLASGRALVRSLVALLRP